MKIYNLPSHLPKVFKTSSRRPSDGLENEKLYVLEEKTLLQLRRFQRLFGDQKRLLRRKDVTLKQKFLLLRNNLNAAQRFYNHVMFLLLGNGFTTT